MEPIHNDYEQALAIAKKENKPVLIDFTGWACVNCRRMEEKIWPDPLVDSLMRKRFVVVSLYVDERNKLPLVEQTVVTLANGTEKPIITVGDKWSTFQTENFGGHFTTPVRYNFGRPGGPYKNKILYRRCR